MRKLKGAQRAAEERLAYHGVEGTAGLGAETFDVLGRLAPTPGQAAQARTGLWETFIRPVLAVSAGIGGIAALVAGGRRRRETAALRAPYAGKRDYPYDVYSAAMDISGRRGVVEVSGRDVSASEYASLAEGMGITTLDGLGVALPSARAEGRWGRFWDWIGQYAPELVLAAGVGTGALGVGAGAAVAGAGYGIGQLLPDISITQGAPSVTTLPAAAGAAAAAAAPAAFPGVNWDLMYLMA